MPSTTVGDLLALTSAGRPQAHEALKQFYEWRQARWVLMAKGFGAASAAASVAAFGESLKALPKDATHAPTRLFLAILAWAVLLACAALVFQAIARSVHREYVTAFALIGPSLPATSP